MKPQPTTLVAGLEKSARREPGKVVVVDHGRYLSYEQLLTAIERRAQVLAQRYRVGAHIGVPLDRSVETVVTYFACLRAGMLYTPLPSLPPRVMTNVLRTLSLDAVVTEKTSMGSVPVVNPDTRPGSSRVALPEETPDRPAHILLTSGSTSGMPKAVVTDQHGSMYSHAWRSKVFPFLEEDVVGCNIFDIWDVIPALHRGVPVVMITDAAMRDPRALAAVLIRHAVTRMMMTPTLFAACLAVPDAVRALNRLRLIVLCGEVVHPRLLERAEAEIPGVAIGGLYSIAECHDVAAGVLHSDSCDPGLRIADFADIYVTEVDHRDRRVEAGVPGRILVAGPGLALGYVGGHRAAARFFELALDGPDRVRVYDTGDLGILHASGKLEVLGRCDAGVKIRGQWVDPQEVAALVSSHPGVIDCAVRAIQGKLVARVVFEPHLNTAATVSDIRAFSKARLPPHSVPGRFEPCATLALGASGKADPGAKKRLGAKDKDIERLVLSAFRDVLDNSAVGPDEDFFESGGDSLDAITLVGVLQRATGHCITMADFHAHSRPVELGRFMQDRPQSEPSWRLPVLEPGMISQGCQRAVRTILMTGASGHLGGALLRACAAFDGLRIITLTRSAEATGENHVRGDLSLPRLGLSESEFQWLGRQIDAILHVAARVDPFASYAALETVNVGGTRELIRLAGLRGLPLHHVSSSSVFPLAIGRTWPEDIRGSQPMKRLAAGLLASGADAYSFSKLAAESLVWQAADQGLPVHVIRVPHVLGHPTRDRLLRTVSALGAAGVFPAGDWGWQFISADTAASAVAAGIRDPAPVRHLAPASLPAARILESLRENGMDLESVSVSAVATALARVPGSHTDCPDVCALAQLITEYGPRAALSLDDAILASAAPIDEPSLTVLRDALAHRSVAGAGRSLN